MSDRFCCDTKCNDNQGRGTCPRFVESVEHDWPLVWVVYAAGICAGFGGSALWRLFT